MNNLGFQATNNSHPVLRSNLSPWAGASLVQRPAPIPSTRSRSSSSNHVSNPCQLYQQLYEVFGDSLAPGIAFNNWQDGAVTKSKLLRIQPLTHAYFPSRPLQRDAKSTRDLINKAKEKLQGKEPLDTTVEGGTKLVEGRKEQPKAKVLPFTFTSTLNKVVRTSFDSPVFEPSRPQKERAPTEREPSRRKSGRGSSKRREADTPMETDEQPTASERADCKVETGKIKRRFRRTRPILASKPKYDYHIGVTL